VPILTDAAIRRCKPTAARRRIRDEGARSLFLVVEPSGLKTFEMRFRRPGGKIAKMRLGPFDLSGREVEGAPQVGQPLSLAAARALAAQVLRERAMGGDPVAAHKARRRARADAAERRDTFAAAVRDYVAEHARDRNRTWRDAARLLGLDYPPDSGEPAVVRGGLAERWGDRPVREIDGHDVWSVVDEARRTGSPGLATRNREPSEARARLLFVALSRLFGWLRRRRWVEANPCQNVPRPPQARSRDRVLTADEVRWFWRACGEAGEPFGAIFRLLLLTGARLNEVAGMRVGELGEDGATWSLPGSRTKNARPHIVPLPAPAREIIESVKQIEGRAGLIFSTTGETPVSGWSRVKRRLDDAMLRIATKERGGDFAIPPWRIHDLRRVAVTNMVEIGVPPHVVEAAVNHVSGAKAGVAGVYNRSQLLPERKAALERWASHVQGIVSSKVVPMRHAGVSA